MEIYSYFYAAWVLFWFFMFGFSLGSGAASMDMVGKRPWGRALFRTPGKEKTEKLYFCLFFWSILILNLTPFLLPECKGCLAGIGAYLDGPDSWKAAVAFLVLLFHGVFIRLLFDLIQKGKARRNVNRFLSDCCAEGCIRAIYEATSLPLYGPFEWVLHDMLRDEYDLWQITKRAADGYVDDPVYIAMNIPPEGVLQKLKQYNLVTKNGYERLPPPKPDHYFPHGGSIVHFYYQAEYVRIWG